MRLKNIYNTNNLAISFEVFPPKTDFDVLSKELEILKKYKPAFVSLTCGAGGKENKSFELIKNIQTLGFEIMPHFTCITSSFKSVENGIKTIENMGIESILALRGDIPEDISLRKYEFNHADELVKFIKEKTKLSIGVAGYPEGHIESPDIKTDLMYLKNKVNTGADAIFTQLFFDNTKLYTFIDNVHNAGIDIHIVAGIMPIISKKQIERMTNLAKITLPKEIIDAMEKYKDNSMVEFGIDYASKQCENLIKNGINKLHFYTLNKSHSTSKILDNIRS